MPTPQATKLLAELKTKPETYWIKRGEKMAMRLFKEMSERVPAYKNFLKKHGVSPKQIKSIADFYKIPPISKENYLKKYPLEKLCWDGSLKKQSWTISATSGSTGKPFYFPRTSEQNKQYALIAEMYLETNFSIHNNSTLYVNAFPMGVWIGGIFTYEAIRLVAENGKYKLSIISPGINKHEVTNVIKNLGKNFDQIIIGSYGPFLKEILDEGLRQKINWKDYKLGFVFSAEGFSENFRDFVLKTCGSKNVYTTTLNHYGTVDLGTMSYETPVAIYVRR